LDNSTCITNRCNSQQSTCSKNNECSSYWNTFQKFLQINPNTANFQLAFAVADCTRKYCCDIGGLSAEECNINAQSGCAQQFCSSQFFECYGKEECLNVVQVYLDNYYHLNNPQYAASHSVAGDKQLTALLNCSAYQCCQFDWTYTAVLAPIPINNNSGGGDNGGGDNGGGNGGNGDNGGSTQSSTTYLWIVPVVVLSLGLIGVIIYFFYRRKRLYQALAAEDDMIEAEAAEKAMKKKRKRKG